MPKPRLIGVERVRSQQRRHGLSQITAAGKKCLLDWGQHRGCGIGISKEAKQLAAEALSRCRMFGNYVDDVSAVKRARLTQERRWRQIMLIAIEEELALTQIPAGEGAG